MFFFNSPVSPTSVWIAPRPLVLDLGPLSIDPGCLLLVAQTLLVLLQLDPRPARHVKRAPHGHHRRHEDHCVADN
jgi:hypothetical protein